MIASPLVNLPVVPQHLLKLYIALDEVERAYVMVSLLMSNGPPWAGRNIGTVQVRLRARQIVWLCKNTDNVPLFEKMATA